MKMIRVLLVVAALIVAGVPVAYSLPSNESDILYYSDDTFTDNVGEKYLGCDGSRYSWGETTPYQHQTGDSCESYGGYDCWAMCYFDISSGQEDCYDISCNYW